MGGTDRKDSKEGPGAHAMEAVLSRAGMWFLLLVLSVAAIATAADGGFAVHMTILAIVAFAALCLTLARSDFDALGNAIVRAPADPGIYDDDPVRWGVIATVGWSIVGLLAGLVIALQLAFPWLNLEPYANFGRLRPLHTSGVVFAFGGNILLATSFYVVQRTCRTRLAFPAAARFVFWGYQLFLVLAASGYIFGITQSRGYGEPEWYVDLWLTIVWVVYFVVFV